MVISYRANTLKKDGTADELQAIVDYIRKYTPKILEESLDKVA